MSSKKIYLVFEGYQCDRQCSAVFDDKEKAENYLKLLNKFQRECYTIEDDIEIFELNKFEEPLEKKDLYICGIHLRDSYYSKKGKIYEYKNVEEVKHNEKQKNYIRINKDRIEVQSWISKEHAHKTLMERYDKYLKDGE